MTLDILLVILMAMIAFVSAFLTTVGVTLFLFHSVESAMGALVFRRWKRMPVEEATDLILASEFECYREDDPRYVHGPVYQSVPAWLPGHRHWRHTHYTMKRMVGAIAAGAHWRIRYPDPFREPPSPTLVISYGTMVKLYDLPKNADEAIRMAYFIKFGETL